MQCNEVRESLVAYLDDEVVAEERERIDSHLASCPACRMEQAGLDSTGDLLRLLGRDADSTIDLAARVIAEASNPWCGHIRRKLVSFVDDELDADDSRPVIEHIADCEDCRTERIGHDRVAAALDAWTVPEFDVDLARRILPKKQAGRLLRIGPAVAAACLLVVAGLYALIDRPEPGTPPAITPIAEEDWELLAGDNLEWLDSVAEQELAMLMDG